MVTKPQTAENTGTLLPLCKGFSIIVGHINQLDNWTLYGLLEQKAIRHSNSLHGMYCRKTQMLLWLCVMAVQHATARMIRVS